MTGLMSLLQSDPAAFVVLAVCLLYSVIAHEVSHGWVAGLFGDDLAKESGRLTANPVAHIDPLGLLMLFVAGFGWAKPVPVNAGFLRRIPFALPVVALAGPATNIAIALAGILLFRLPLIQGFPILAGVIPIVVKINIMLAAFNLIPLPPLDGSKVLAEFLPQGARAVFMRWDRYGFLILMVLLYTGVLDPVITLAQKGVYGFISLSLALLGQAK